MKGKSKRKNPYASVSADRVEALHGSNQPSATVIRVDGASDLRGKNKGKSRGGSVK